MKVEIDIKETYDLRVIIQNNVLNDEVTRITEMLKAKDGKLVGKKKDAYYLIEPQEIVFFYTEGQKIKGDTLESTYIFKEKLYNLEESMKHLGFIRISKFAIANIDMIKKLEAGFNGNMIIHFKNGRSENISRRYLSSVKSEIFGGRK